MGLDKVIIACDERIAAKAVGLVCSVVFGRGRSWSVVVGRSVRGTLKELPPGGFERCFLHFASVVQEKGSNPMKKTHRPSGVCKVSGLLNLLCI